MKKLLLSLFIGSICFLSCKKEQLSPVVDEPCQLQTDNPTSRSYDDDSLREVNYTGKNCGLMPLSKKDYWVYQDSIFTNGAFLQIQYDTLRFGKTYRSLSDNLIWWEANIEVGLPELLYASDSTIFEADKRMFSNDVTWDAKREYSLFSGQTLSYLTSFDDNAAIGKSVKLDAPLTTPAGTFTDCIQFEKNARSYRKDETYFKPGIGVVKYTQEKAPMGSPVTKLQQVSTLISFHIE